MHLVTHLINGQTDTLIAAYSALTTYEKKYKENVMGPESGNNSQLQQNLAKFSDICLLRTLGVGKSECLNSLYLHII